MRMRVRENRNCVSRTRVYCVRLESIRKWAFQMICSCSSSLILYLCYFRQTYTLHLSFCRSKCDCIQMRDRSFFLFILTFKTNKPATKNRRRRRWRLSSQVYFSTVVWFPINRLNVEICARVQNFEARNCGILCWYSVCLPNRQHSTFETRIPIVFDTSRIDCTLWR